MKQSLHKLRPFRRWCWVCLLMIFIGATHAQEAIITDADTIHTGGVISETSTVPLSEIVSLNPLRCDSNECQRVTSWLFPMLFAIDPATQQPVDAHDRDGLALNIEPQAAETYRVTLREDMTWSDGVPITAYDVFYSYLAVKSRIFTSPYTATIQEDVPFMRVVDDHTLEIYFSSPDCQSITDTNMPVVPYHVFDTDFAESYAAFSAEGTPEEQYNAWVEHYPNTQFRAMVGHDFDLRPHVTAGNFVFRDFTAQEHIRLETPDGRLAYELHEPDAQISAVDAFRQGKTDILVNPPPDVRDSLTTLQGVQSVEYPGLSWYYMAFNFAEPYRGRSAFNNLGDPVEQGQHPLFSDIRIRQAVQYALNVQELIEVGAYGYGTPMSAQLLPQSWANDETLAPIPYDPDAARQLLEEAGWRDRGNNGILDCIHCLYAEPGTALSINLSYDNTAELGRIAKLIQRQLEAVGIGAYIYPVDFNEITYQQFDLYLGTWHQRFPISPDSSDLFAREEDIVGSGLNIGSYVNPEAEALLQDARTIPLCNITEQAEMYHAVEQMLQQDLPYAWLFAPNDLVLVRDTIIGFDPLPNQPFWNIETWRVAR